MATIHVDGQSYEVDGADNLLQACLSLGLDIPYLYWRTAHWRQAPTLLMAGCQQK